jgi:hypothetical protein
MKKTLLYLLIGIMSLGAVRAEKLLIPMDLAQTNHLKAYGIAFWVIKGGQPVDWLLNYRDGSFMMDMNEKIVLECRIRGVSFEQVSDGNASEIYSQVQADNVNQDVVKLEKTPKIAVYVPKGTQPWDDAVRMALEYAEVEYDMVWDEDVIKGKLKEYDWLHLHHEDFTGQYGKFWANYRNAPWYIQQVALNENMAQKLGYSKVSQMKLDVAKTIKEYVANGGFLFAMCSATDSYDIALAADGVDIVASMMDGDGQDPNAQSKLDYSNTFAFKDFNLRMNPAEYEYSDIDVGATSINNPESDYFTLFEFSAKYDPVPTMLTQCHTGIVHGFLGQTTAFAKEKIKKSVTILAEREGTNEVRYIHSNFGRGTFTWYGGHDPEDYRHGIGDPPTDLDLHKNSPGYRLILNNILFPAAKKKKQKT